jgi:hypothetical protein
MSIITQEQIDVCLAHIDSKENKEHFLKLMQQQQRGEKEVNIQLTKLKDWKEKKKKKIDYDGNIEDEARSIYRVCITRRGKDRSVCFIFSNSIANTINNQDPSLYDILASIKLKCNITISQDFRNFCQELGYNPSFKKDYKTYKKTVKLMQNIKAIFDENEIMTFPSYK